MPAPEVLDQKSALRDPGYPGEIVGTIRRPSVIQPEARSAAVTMICRTLFCKMLNALSAGRAVDACSNAFQGSR
jgi:hypothetical protein